MDCIFPDKITAGLTFSKLVTLTTYAAPTWVLSIILRGPSSIDLTATAEGSQHRLAADAATTASWAPGEYWYSARVTGPGGVYEVDSGQVVVLPDLAGVGAGGPHDGRSHARRTLDAINAVIEKRATKDQERYVIEGQNGVRRELWRTPLADLLLLRNQYAAMVRQEERKAKGKPMFAQVRVRF